MGDDTRYLYVIGFSDRTVKVGQTRDMRRRFKAHQWWGRRRGLTVPEVNFGLRYGSALPDEKKLIRFCEKRWQQLPGHREFFVEADFDEVDRYFMELERVAFDARFVVGTTAGD